MMILEKKISVSIIWLLFSVCLQSNMGWSATTDSLNEFPPCKKIKTSGRPDSADFKTIRLMFHVIRKSDLSGSFRNTNENIEKYFSDVTDYINYRLSHNELPKPNSGSALITDVGLRIQSRVHFWDEDSLFNMFQINDNPSAEFFYAFILKQETLTDEEKNGRLHIIIMPRKDRPILGGSAAGLCDKRYIQFKGTDWEYNDRLGYGGQNNYDYAVATHGGHILHEMGHSLCLMHNFCCGTAGYQEDACTDNNDSTGKPPVQWSSNNYMDYTGWSETRSYSACQIGIIHRSLADDINGLGDLLEVDPCKHSKSGETKTYLQQDADAIWKEDVVYQKVKLERHVSAPCGLNLTDQAKVIIDNQGLLTIVNATAEVSCAGTKRKIVVKKGGYLVLNQAKMNDVVIVVQKGGTLLIERVNQFNRSSLILKSGAAAWGKGLNALLEMDSESKTKISNRIKRDLDLSWSSHEYLPIEKCLKFKAIGKK